MDRAEFLSGKSGMTGEEVIEMAADDSVGWLCVYGCGLSLSVSGWLPAENIASYR